MSIRQPDAARSAPNPIPERLIFGRSRAMEDVRQSVAGVAGASVPVLVLGQSGTGKELVSREIHRLSPWQSSPFIKISAAEKGATGELENVLRSSPGPVGSGSSACTLFIDHVNRLESAVQAKLLEFFHDGLSSQLSAKSIPHQNARVICASSRNLEDDVAGGHFRMDLFYRINVVTINLPRLSDRKEDIPDLAEFFFESSCRARGRSCPRLTMSLLQLFYEHDWPGNVRELQDCVAAYVDADGAASAAEALISKGNPIGQNPALARRITRMPLKVYTRQLVEQAERDLILRVLREQRWNRKETAKVLQVSYQTLLHKLKLIRVDKGCASSPGKIIDEVPEGMP